MPGWLDAVLSWVSRGWCALAWGRTPKCTASAEAGWMARFGDTEEERAAGRRRRRRIDRLPINAAGHCDAAIEEHLAFWAGRLQRVAELDPAAAERIRAAGARAGDVRAGRG